MTARNVNLTKNLIDDSYMVRVICPNCRIGGGTYSTSPQPKCYRCGELMNPASNNKCECSWNDLLNYLKSKD